MPGRLFTPYFDLSGVSTDLVLLSSILTDGPGPSLTFVANVGVADCESVICGSVVVVVMFLLLIVLVLVHFLSLVFLEMVLVLTLVLRVVVFVVVVVVVASAVALLYPHLRNFRPPNYSLVAHRTV